MPENPNKMADRLLSELRDMTESREGMGRLPVADLNFRDFVYHVTGIPVEGYHDTSAYVGDDKHLAWPPVANEMMEMLENPMITRYIILVARQHLKTTIISDLYPAWRIARDPSIRIAEISHAKAQTVRAINNAEEYLNSVGVKWEKNDEEEKVVVRPHTGLLRRDPTLVALGLDSKMHGGHFDLMILDDCVVQENSYTPHQREKFKAWFTTMIPQMLESTGTLIATGVRWASADYHGELANEKFHPEYKMGCIVRPACTDTFENVIYPKKWGKETLIQRKREIGPASFASQFLLNPTLLESGVFKNEWIFGEGSSEYSELPPLTQIAMGVDPSQGKGQNYFCVCIAGVGADMKLYVLKFYKEDITTGEQPNRVFELYQQEHVNKAGIETVQYQIIIASMVERLAKEAGVAVNIQDFPVCKIKDLRLQELSGPFYNGIIRFPSVYITKPDGLQETREIPWRSDFTEEYSTFPTGASDDMLDALYYAYKAANLGLPLQPQTNYAPVILVGKTRHNSVLRHPRLSLRRNNVGSI
jgi:predicted phage terminase large subunit-like protein